MDIKPLAYAIIDAKKRELDEMKITDTFERFLETRKFLRQLSDALNGLYTQDVLGKYRKDTSS